MSSAFLDHIYVRSYSVCLSLSDPLLSHCMYSPWVISFEPVALITICMPMNISCVCPPQIFHLQSRTTLLLPTLNSPLVRIKGTPNMPIPNRPHRLPHLAQLHPTCSFFRVLYKNLPRQPPFSHTPCHQVFYIAIA